LHLRSRPTDPPVTRSPIASSVTVVNYNAAEEMRKGVPEQSQCGALFTSIASHVIHSSHLDGDYTVRHHVLYFIIITQALPRILPPPPVSISLPEFPVYIFRLRRLAGGIIPLRTGSCTVFFVKILDRRSRRCFFFMDFPPPPRTCASYYIVIFGVPRRATTLVTTWDTRPLAVSSESLRYGSVKSRSSESGA